MFPFLSVGDRVAVFVKIRQQQQQHQSSPSSAAPPPQPLLSFGHVTSFLESLKETNTSAIPSLLLGNGGGVGMGGDATKASSASSPTVASAVSVIDVPPAVPLTATANVIAAIKQTSSSASASSSATLASCLLGGSTSSSSSSLSSSGTATIGVWVTGTIEGIAARPMPMMATGGTAPTSSSTAPTTEPPDGGLLRSVLLGSGGSEDGSDSEGLLNVFLGVDERAQNVSDRFGFTDMIEKVNKQQKGGGGGLRSVIAAPLLLSSFESAAGTTTTNNSSSSSGSTSLMPSVDGDLGSVLLNTTSTVLLNAAATTAQQSMLQIGGAKGGVGSSSPPPTSSSPSSSSSSSLPSLGAVLSQLFSFVCVRLDDDSVTGVNQSSLSSSSSSSSSSTSSLAQLLQQHLLLNGNNGLVIAPAASTFVLPLPSSLWSSSSRHSSSSASSSLDNLVSDLSSSANAMALLACQKRYLEPFKIYCGSGGVSGGGVSANNSNNSPAGLVGSPTSPSSPSSSTAVVTLPCRPYTMLNDDCLIAVNPYRNVPEGSVGGGGGGGASSTTMSSSVAVATTRSAEMLALPGPRAMARKAMAMLLGGRGGGANKKKPNENRSSPSSSSSSATAAVDRVAIVVTGCSGAGKTVAANIVLSEVTAAGGSSSGSREGVTLTSYEMRQLMEKCVPSTLLPPTQSSSSLTTARASFILQKLVDAAPALESFGNAPTRNNHNSSRFVKTTSIYIADAALKVGGGMGARGKGNKGGGLTAVAAAASSQIAASPTTAMNPSSSSFSPSTIDLTAVVGAVTRCHLLETTRVIGGGGGGGGGGFLSDDNPFHVFNLMFQHGGLSHEQRTRFDVWDASLFKCMTSRGGGGGGVGVGMVGMRPPLMPLSSSHHSPTVTSPSSPLPSAASSATPFTFKQVVNSLSSIGFTAEAIDSILAALAGVMHLSNVEFMSAVNAPPPSGRGGGGVVVVPDEFAPCTVNKDGKDPSSGAALRQAAQLLLGDMYASSSAGGAGEDGLVSIAHHSVAGGGGGAGSFNSFDTNTFTTPAGLPTPEAVLLQSLTTVTFGPINNNGSGGGGGGGVASMGPRLLHKAAAMAARDTLAKCIYQGLFDMIVCKLNASCCGEGPMMTMDTVINGGADALRSDNGAASASDPTANPSSSVPTPTTAGVSTKDLIAKAMRAMMASKEANNAPITSATVVASANAITSNTSNADQIKSQSSNIGDGGGASSPSPPPFFCPTHFFTKTMGEFKEKVDAFCKDSQSGAVLSNALSSLGLLPSAIVVAPKTSPTSSSPLVSSPSLSPSSVVALSVSMKELVLLDICGFESYDDGIGGAPQRSNNGQQQQRSHANDLEQLLINYTNEALQLLYLESTLGAMGEELAAEGVLPVKGLAGVGVGDANNTPAADGGNAGDASSASTLTSTSFLANTFAITPKDKACVEAFTSRTRPLGLLRVLADEGLLGQQVMQRGVMMGGGGGLPAFGGNTNNSQQQGGGSEAAGAMFVSKLLQAQQLTAAGGRGSGVGAGPSSPSSPSSSSSVPTIITGDPLNPSSFCVQHYCGKSRYTANNFAFKNRINRDVFDTIARRLGGGGVDVLGSGSAVAAGLLFDKQQQPFFLTLSAASAAMSKLLSSSSSSSPASGNTNVSGNAAVGPSSTSYAAPLPRGTAAARIAAMVAGSGGGGKSGALTAIAASPISPSPLTSASPTTADAPQQPRRGGGGEDGVASPLSPTYFVFNRAAQRRHGGGSGGGVDVTQDGDDNDAILFDDENGEGQANAFASPLTSALDYYNTIMSTASGGGGINSTHNANASASLQQRQAVKSQVAQYQLDVEGIIEMLRGGGGGGGSLSSSSSSSSSALLWIRCIKPSPLLPSSPSSLSSSSLSFPFDQPYVSRQLAECGVYRSFKALKQGGYSMRVRHSTFCRDIVGPLLVRLQGLMITTTTVKGAAATAITAKLSTATTKAKGPLSSPKFETSLTTTPSASLSSYDRPNTDNNTNINNEGLRALIDKAVSLLYQCDYSTLVRLLLMKANTAAAAGSGASDGAKKDSLLSLLSGIVPAAFPTLLDWVLLEGLPNMMIIASSTYATAANGADDNASALSRLFSSSLLPSRRIIAGMTKLFMEPQLYESVLTPAVHACALSTASLLHAVAKGYLVRKRDVLEAYLLFTREKRIKQITQRLAEERPIRELLEQQREVLFASDAAGRGKFFRTVVAPSMARLLKVQLKFKDTIDGIGAEIERALRELAAMENGRKEKEKQVREQLLHEEHAAEARLAEKRKLLEERDKFHEKKKLREFREQQARVAAEEKLPISTQRQKEILDSIANGHLARIRAEKEAARRFTEQLGTEKRSASAAAVAKHIQESIKRITNDGKLKRSQDEQRAVARDLLLDYTIAESYKKMEASRRADFLYRNKNNASSSSAISGGGGALFDGSAAAAMGSASGGPFRGYSQANAHSTHDHHPVYAVNTSKPVPPPMRFGPSSYSSGRREELDGGGGAGGGVAGLNEDAPQQPTTTMGLVSTPAPAMGGRRANNPHFTSSSYHDPNSALVRSNSSSGMRRSNRLQKEAEWVQREHSAIVDGARQRVAMLLREEEEGDEGEPFFDGGFHNNDDENQPTYPSATAAALALAGRSVSFAGLSPRKASQPTSNSSNNGRNANNTKAYPISHDAISAAYREVLPISAATRIVVAEEGNVAWRQQQELWAMQME